jgi:hypothetical protein
MESLLKLLKNKFALTAVAISLLVLIMIIALSPKKNNTTASPDGSPTTVSQLRSALSNLSLGNTAKTSADLELESKLPLYLDTFATSVDINTSINLFRTEGDPSQTVHLEIAGISYLNPDTNTLNNPNVVAFRESYLKAIELLEGQNIDPQKLTFIFSNKTYIQTNSEAWVTALNLRP